MNATEQKRAFGVFSDSKQVEETFHQLKESGFPMDHVSIVFKEAEKDKTVEGAKVSDHIGDQNLKTPMGVVKDTLTLSTWGFLLVGLTSLAIPGLGPILAAGSLGAALVATTAGTGASVLAINNVVKALTDLGLTKAEAGVYSDHLLQGNYLVMVEGTPDEIEQAQEIFGNQKVQDWSIYVAV